MDYVKYDKECRNMTGKQRGAHALLIGAAAILALAGTLGATGTASDVAQASAAGRDAAVPKPAAPWFGNAAVAQPGPMLASRVFGLDDLLMIGAADAAPNGACRACSSTQYDYAVDHCLQNSLPGGYEMCLIINHGLASPIAMDLAECMRNLPPHCSLISQR
jgi:hypothetical protein